MPVDDRPIAEAFAVAADLARALGVERINELPGCWEYDLSGGEWRIAINGHGEPMSVADHPHWHEPITPYTMLVFRNGWPVAEFDPFGGTLFGVSEDTFIDALHAEIQAVTR